MRSRGDVFHIVTKDDHYNKGDIITFGSDIFGDSSFIIIKTFRRTWWRLFLFYTHLMRDRFFINSKDRCVYLIKKLQ